MLRTVKIKHGILHGLPAADPRISVFKGVPFAKPPVNQLRFMPPQEIDSYYGEKNCFEFSSIPVQPSPSENPSDDDLYSKEWSVDPNISVSEDCLYLNVWTPAKKTDEKLPVYVWFYGGGWQVGHTAEMEFDGERIARRGIVVVTVNYRVNLFGFLCHPEITKINPDKPCNMGLLDQQCALKWVFENIESFGGDSKKITIGGQSAGGGSVLCHITNADSRKFFSRAVVESGVFDNSKINFLPRHNIKEAEKLGEEFFEFCGVKSLSEAQKLSTDFLRKKWQEWGDFEESIRTWTPIVDDNFVTFDFVQSVEDGIITPPPLLIGFTPDEFLFNGESTMDYGIQKLFAAEEKNGLKNKNYFYKFAVPIPGWDNPGVFHSSDLWFFFETLAKCWRPFTGVHYDMARKICNYLCNFIKNGDPNGKDLFNFFEPSKKTEGNELPLWQPFSFNTPNMMEFSTECKQIFAEKL